MSFPNYSSLFTLGLSSSSAGPSKPAPVPAQQTKKSTGGRRRSRAHSLKSFLKLDTRNEPAPPMPALPIVTPHTPVSSTHSSPKSPPAPLMCRRSRETLRSIPSPKPMPVSQTLPEPPSLGLPMPLLSPSASPASAISTLPPSTPPPPAVRPVSECTTDTASLSVRPPAPARKSSTALGLGIGLGLTEVKPNSYSNRMSVAASSVASPRRRRVQRSAALANLEGRTSAEKARAAPSMRNFMSMSDDEDDEAPQPRSAPVSPSIPSDVSSKSHRSRALSDVSSVVLRADFLDFGLSPTSTMMSSPSILAGDMADDGFRALDAALFAALGSGGSKSSQTFSSFIDVSA